jgi:predicted nucleotidyltransferase
MNTQESIDLAGQRLVEAVGPSARVILFGSAARGELTRDSDLDFLVIEREVENRITEAVRLRDAVGGIGRPSQTASQRSAQQLSRASSSSCQS